MMAVFNCIPCADDDALNESGEKENRVFGGGKDVLRLTNSLALTPKEYKIGTDGWRVLFNTCLRDNGDSLRVDSPTMPWDVKQFIMQYVWDYL